MYPIIKENLKLMGPPKEVANSGDVIDLICDFISKKVIEEAKLGRASYSFSVTSLLEAHHEKILEILGHNFPDCDISVKMDLTKVAICVDWS